jgi:glycosyltransferase involved in cell wall biosynthesis
MRIAINVEQLLQPSPGGIGRYSAALVSLLPTLYPDDELIPFAALHRPRDVNRVADALGVASIVSLPLPRPLLYEGWQLASWPPLHLRRGPVDVVHAPSVAVPPKRSEPLVVTVHDVAFALFPHAYSRRGRRFHAAGLAAAAHRADLVITASHSAAAEILRYSSVDADRIRVVPHGVESVKVTPERARASAVRMGLADRRYVLWVGSLEPRKGVGTLVSAFAELRRRGGAQGVVLVLAGFPGWLSDGLIDTADRRVLGDDLRQLGQLPEEDLWPLYAGADICAVPSRHEGFGLPVLEAMSQGTAVVCSDLPVLREVGGDAAEFVTVGQVDAWADALGALLDDDHRRAAFALAGRAHAAAFTWERSVRATRAVYAEATGSKTR